LDANLREEMRVELKHIQRELGIATIFVTHDQSEALALSDRVVVMNQGSIEQVGSPQEVYNNPATEFVAGFLGQSNILSAEIAAEAGDTLKVRVKQGGQDILVAPRQDHDWAQGTHVRLVMRAENLLLAEQHDLVAA